MTMTVEEVAPGEYRGAAVALLARYVNPAYDEARFDWLYRLGPAGPGRLWIAREAGAVVGSAGAFPRSLCVNGTSARGWVLGDFCVAESHRTLGPALALQRACLEGLGAGRSSWCYDFPGPSMMAVYQRLRAGAVQPMGRFVKVLRTDAVLGRYVKNSAIARPIGAALDVALAYRGRSRPGPGAVAVELLSGRCDEEFSALSTEAAGRYVFCLERTAEYLNWRYRENPVRKHEILTARIGRDLVAFAVFTQEKGAGTLVDAFGLPDLKVVRGVLHGAVALARQRGCSTLGFSIVDSHPWYGSVRRLGFSRRETRPVVVLAPTEKSRQPVAGGEALFLTQGDSDN